MAVELFKINDPLKLEFGDSFSEHDGFLIEVEKITEVVRKFYNSKFRQP